MPVRLSPIKLKELIDEIMSEVEPLIATVEPDGDRHRAGRGCRSSGATGRRSSRSSSTS